MGWQVGGGEGVKRKGVGMEGGKKVQGENSLTISKSAEVILN